MACFHAPAASGARRLDSNAQGATALCIYYSQGDRTINMYFDNVGQGRSLGGQTLVATPWITLIVWLTSGRQPIYNVVL